MGRVSRIAPDGTRTTFADGLSGPSGLGVGPDGAIYVASYSRDEIYRFTPDGVRSLHVTGLATPAGIGFDRTGGLLIANHRTNQILRLTPTKPPPIVRRADRACPHADRNKLSQRDTIAFQAGSFDFHQPRRSPS
jgi:hypothetical protein